RAALGLSGEAALDAMGRAYGELLADRDLLLLQLHAYAACEDDEIRKTTRRCYRELWQKISEIAELPASGITDFVAKGMLLNVVAALDASDLGEEWVKACLSG